jgi:hypothetical protein
MRKHLTPSVLISIVAIVSASTGLAEAARHSVEHALRIDGHVVSAKPHAGGILLLDKDGKFPAAAIPTAYEASRLDGKTAGELEPTCPPSAANMGTWCLDLSTYPLPEKEPGVDNWFWASRKCVELGGFLPSVAQLIGATKRVSLQTTLTDKLNKSVLEETNPRNPSLKDKREMSSTLVTTRGGSAAAGSFVEPEPEAAQYVTVFSNEQKGGLAGGEPVDSPENFRCAYYKSVGAINYKEENLPGLTTK